MGNARLEDRHLADLHALAAELDVPRFRMLGRGELAAAIRERGGGDEVDEPADVEADEPADEEVETEDVTGVLDVMPRRFGFLRLTGLEAAEGDVYVSASQIRRCELLPGDEVSGPARPARRDERHPALVHVDRVNGGDPATSKRRAFDDLTAVPPSRRLDLGSPSTGSEEGDSVVRAVDLLAPLALGQRVLVSVASGSDRATLLRALTVAISGGRVASGGPAAVIVALVDERPEEATRWREIAPDAELALATAEMPSREQVALVELALARAKRLVESGGDVVLIVDSLSRLAVAQGDTAPVKRLFGSGRETREEGAGSLTVIATMLDEDEEDGEGLRAVRTTENVTIRLDESAAAAEASLTLDVGATQSTDERGLREGGELEAARALRARLADAGAEAARELGELIADSKSNEELLSRLG